MTLPFLYFSAVLFQRAVFSLPAKMLKECVIRHFPYMSKRANNAKHTEIRHINSHCEETLYALSFFGQANLSAKCSLTYQS